MKYLICIVGILLVSNTTKFKTTNVSWYGKPFHGRKTANGEIYDMYALTCASPTLKFNTKILVINTVNNAQVLVRVNDRGPYENKVVTKDGKTKIIPYRPLKNHKTRDLDLSKGAFMTIADTKQGVVKVKYKILK